MRGIQLRSDCTAVLGRPVSIQQTREILSNAPGLELVDEPHSNRYPMPLNVAGKDYCQVGRVRLDCALDNGLSFWVSGDQLLKGAALNAVQIAELLYPRNDGFPAVNC
jgi:aspartate-semialdehyde dehydrogenase